MNVNINQKVQIYKFRGHTLEVLNELRHLAGATIRMISDRTLAKPRVLSVVLQRMKRYNVVEKIEGWGWKITSFGIEVLKFLSSSSNSNNVNTSTTTGEHMINTNEPEIKKKATEIIPKCFYRKCCHIRTIRKKDVFNSETRKQCENCIHDDPSNYIQVNNCSGNLKDGVTMG